MFKKVLVVVFYYSLLPFLLVALLLIKKNKKKIMWGPIPMINYKYASESVKKIGYDTETVVSGYYSIYSKGDFDRYYEEFFPQCLRKFKPFIIHMGNIFAFVYAVRYAKVINISNNGSFLGSTPLDFIEGHIFKYFGIKTVLSGYGADYYMYSKVQNVSLRHALIMSYPDFALKEKIITEKVGYWTKHADIIIGSYSTDNIGRWDCIPVNMVNISDENICEFKIKKQDPVSPIQVLHAPNHRGFKGTEFIIKAVEELVNEGFDINFILVEGLKNTEVLRLLREEADILVEQIVVGYGLNGIEGMACGVPVLSCLEGESYEMLRRYSYLNECPIVSTTHENIKENLRELINNHNLRQELGRLGIEFVKKYHSDKGAQYLYGKVYNQLLNKVDEDLINMFHPLKSQYSQNNYIHTPLYNGKLKQEYNVRD